MPAEVFTGIPKPKPSPLLRLSAEILLQILGECPQNSRAQIAQTASALYNVGTTALFRDVQLPPYYLGESFRQACLSKPHLKNHIRSLSFPATINWLEWLRWDYAVGKLPALRYLSPKSDGFTVDGDPEGHSLWQVLRIVTELAPDVRRLSFDRAYILPETGPGLINLHRVRQLELNSCSVHACERMFKELARLFPHLAIMSVVNTEGISDTWLDGLAGFSQLRVLHLVDVTGNFPRTAPANHIPRIFEFPSLDALSLHSTSTACEITSILERVSLPRLRQLELYAGEYTNLESLAALLLSDRTPQLSAIRIFYDSLNTSMTLRNFMITPLFLPLREAGFEFHVVHRQESYGYERLWWEAKRGEYIGRAFDLLWH